MYIHSRIYWRFYEDRIAMIYHHSYCLWKNKGRRRSPTILSAGCLTLYIKSWEPEPMDTLHPSFLFLPWFTSCNPPIQSKSGFKPAVSPYCRPWARSSPSRVNLTSSWAFEGDFAVNVSDLNGKVDGLVFQQVMRWVLEISPTDKGYELKTRQR